MAQVYVNNAMVERVFWEGKGAAVAERFTVQGQERTRRWSLFFDAPHNLREGQIVSVKGLFSDKPETYTRKDGGTGVTSNLTINKPELIGVAEPEPPAKVNEAAINQVWPTVTPGGATDEPAPF
jgi:hypothetical protein